MLSELMLQIYAAVLPPLLVILGTILGRILAKAAKVAQDRWGIEIEARHRETLQSAMMTGIAAALARGLNRDEAVNAAIQHAVGAGARDAVEFFDLGIEDLTRLAESKLPAPDATPQSRNVGINPGITARTTAPVRR